MKVEIQQESEEINSIGGVSLIGGEKQQRLLMRILDNNISASRQGVPCT
jgi:hypothetical protein